jgi:hypothetical protein
MRSGGAFGSRWQAWNRGVRAGVSTATAVGREGRTDSASVNVDRAEAVTDHLGIPVTAGSLGLPGRSRMLHLNEPTLPILGQLP